MEQTQDKKSWFDRNYKFLFIIPIILVIISLVYIGFFYSQHGDIMLKDSSLAGGTTITVNGNANSDTLASALKGKFQDLSIRKLTELTTGNQIAIIIESSAKPEDLKPEIEKVLGYSLDDNNSSTEFTGPALSQGFYKQLLIALVISFCLMSIVIFVMFRTFIPSTAVIFAAFSDIIMPLALLDFLGVRISAAGIAAFLMLIGYSVDTDILLTTRALKKQEGRLNDRIFGAFKTGIIMTVTALASVLPAFFIVSGLPDSFRQIFLILALGLFADIISTWLTNVGIIKWYCERNHIN